LFWDKKHHFVGSETDHKHKNNAFMFGLSKAVAKVSLPNSNFLNESFYKDDLSAPLFNSKLLASVTNQDINHVFKNLKSPNISFLSSDKNARLTGQTRVGKTSQQFDSAMSTKASFEKGAFSRNLAGNESSLLLASSLKNLTPDLATRLMSTGLTFSAAHPPIASNNPLVTTYAFDKFAKGQNIATPTLLKSKEDVASPYIFSAY
jgi:hypothetical protein